MEFNNSDFEQLFDEEAVVISTEEPQNTPEPEPEPSPEPEPQPEDTDESLKVLFEYAKEKGIFDLPDDFEFDGTPTKIDEALSLSRSRRRETTRAELLSELASDLKPLLNELTGGGSIQEFLQVYNEPDYDNLDLSNEDIQRAVIFEYFQRTTKHPPEKIEKLIERLEPEDLEAEALDAIEYMKEFTRQKREALISKVEQEKLEREALIKEQTTKLTSLIDTNPALDESRKSRLKTFMFVPVKDGDLYSTQLSKTMAQITANPEHLLQLADILADYNPSRGLDLDRLKKRLDTDKNKNFKEFLNSRTDTKHDVSGGSTKKVVDDLD